MSADPHLIRTVWALVSADPQIGARKMAWRLHVTEGDIRRAITVLIDAGYIGHKISSAPRPIHLPLVTGCITGRRETRKAA